MDMETLLAQANALQEKVNNAQNQLASMHVKGIADGGAVIIDMTGKYDLANLTIRDDVMSRGAAAVAELVSAAYNDAKQKADEYINKALYHLDIFGERADILRDIASFITERNS